MADSERFDVVIAGGGQVGAALACALGMANFRVALIEKREPHHDWPAEEIDLRVSALTRASQRILQNLGAWERMRSLRVSPYQEMEVWDAGGSGRIRFSAADLGEPDLGHIVENRVTQLALWERLRRLETVTPICGDELAGFDITGNGNREEVTVQLHCGRVLHAALLVGAEGASSPVREMAGITSSGWAYDQHAIVATIGVERHHDETARQRFMPTGPLAFLPLDDHRCSIVWSTSPTEAERLMALDDETFCAELTEASEGMCGAVLEIGPRGVFPLRLRNADQYVRPGLALVGDAAHGIHPLAGQGVNLGLLDAATLADVLIEARAQNRPLGSYRTLRRYERARKGADMLMLGAMDFFKRLFSNTNPPLTLLRNIGLGLADRSGPMKDLITRRAMGLTGELPALARPGVSNAV